MASQDRMTISAAISRAKTIVSATDRAITEQQLRTAMTINIVTGSGAVLWYAVCVPNQLLNVFFQNILGASSTQLGLLVAVTQVATLFQLFSIYIYGKLRTRKLFWAICHVPHRLYGLVLVAVALSVAHGGSRTLGIRLIICGLAASWVLTMVASTGWWTWQADLYPERMRATFFGRRSAVLATVGMVWFFGVTLALDMLRMIDSLYVYAAIFAVATLAGVADIVFHVLIPEPVRADSNETTTWSDFIEPLRNRNFMRYAVGMGLWAFSTGFAGPFFAPYITSPRAIGAPIIWLGVLFAISQTAWIATVGTWGKLMDRYGRKPVVLLCSLWPLTWTGYLVLTHGNYMVVLPVLALLGGILSPGCAEGSMQLLLTLAPGKNRTAYVAWYTTLIGLIAAGGAVLGGRLNDALISFHRTIAGAWRVNGFHIVIGAGLVLCLISLVFINRVEEPQSTPVRRLLREMARRPG